MTYRITDQTALTNIANAYNSVLTDATKWAAAYQTVLDALSNDGSSGDTVWLLDLIAADRKQATSVLANFRKVAGERPVKIAPLVARLIDPEVAERLRGTWEKDETAAALSKAYARGTV